MQVSSGTHRLLLKTEPVLEGQKSWEVNYIAPWDAASMKLLVGRPYRAGRTRRIGLSANLVDAINAADSFAKQKLAPGNLGLGYAKSGKNDGLFVVNSYNSLLRNAAWRRAPSTKPQQEILAKVFGISMEAGSGYVAPEKAHIRTWCRVPDKKALTNLTKGAAADLITRMRSGAKVYTPILTVCRALTIVPGYL